MRWVLLVLCGCGRLGFDASHSDDAGADAPHASVDAPLLALDAGECPPSYMLVGASCYRASSANAGWLAAELACEADAVGAHLVVIDDVAEYAAVMSTYDTTLRTWIGLSRRASASYLTVINTAGYRDLTSSQTETSEDCAAIDTTAHMGTHSCADLDRYLCEYDGVPAVPSSY
jgi:hypothetical protein